VRIELLERDPAAARVVLDEARAAGGCPEDALDAIACTTVLWPLAAELRWEEVWETVWTCGPGAAGLPKPPAEGAPETLPEEPPADDRQVFAVMAALETGRTDAARALRDRIAARTRPAPGEQYSTRPAMRRHVEGLVAAGTGDPRAGAEHLRAADRMTVWGGAMGTFKLFNRLQLAGMLAAAGDAEAAQREIDALAAVNHPFASRPPLPPLHPVPAPRRSAAPRAAVPAPLPPPPPPVPAPAAPGGTG